MCIYILNYHCQYCKYSNIFVYIYAYIFIGSYASLINNVPPIVADDLSQSQY